MTSVASAWLRTQSVYVMMSRPKRTETVKSARAERAAGRRQAGGDGSREERRVCTVALQADTNGKHTNTERQRGDSAAVGQGAAPAERRRRGESGGGGRSGRPVPVMPCHLGTVTAPCREFQLASRPAPASAGPSPIVWTSVSEGGGDVTPATPP